MKKERNCGYAPYPIYQQMPQMMPNMVNPAMFPPMVAPGVAQNNLYQPQMTDNLSSNTIEQQMNQLQRQITNLESRVSKLESIVNTIGNTSLNSTQYSTGNYHIV